MWSFSDSHCKSLRTQNVPTIPSAVIMDKFAVYTIIAFAPFELQTYLGPFKIGARVLHRFTRASWAKWPRITSPRRHFCAIRGFSRNRQDQRNWSFLGLKSWNQREPRWDSVAKNLKIEQNQRRKWIYLSGSMKTQDVIVGSNWRLVFRKTTE